MRLSLVLFGVAAVALAGCDRIEWHIFQETEEEAPATLDELGDAVDELDTEEPPAETQDREPKPQPEPEQEPEPEPELEKQPEPEPAPAEEPAPADDTAEDAADDEPEEVVEDPAEEPVVIDLGISSDGVLAITRARILTMDETVIEDGTVLVRDGLILAVGSNVRIPDDAEELDVEGMTLLPGLVDMQVHHWSEAEGPLYIANGITTVRNLWGTGQTFRLDQGANDGAFPGPRIYTPGPLMDGPEPVWGPSSVVVETPEQAIGAVRAQKAAGFGAVNLFEKLPESAFRAAVAEAKRLDMKVYTHTPGGMSVRDVIDLKVDSLEHLDGVATAILSSDYRSTEGQSTYLARWAAIDPDKTAALAKEFARKDVASCLSLAVTSGRYAAMLDPQKFWRSDVGAYVPSSTRQWWDRSAKRTAPSLSANLIRQARAGQMAFVKALHDAGAEILIGSDTPNPYAVQGFAMHDELNAFVEAGLPPAEVLAIATRGAAEFLDADDTFGRVADGLRADFIIVDGDPLSNISVLRTPTYVIAGGEVYDRQEMAAMLKDIAASVRATAQ